MKLLRNICRILVGIVFIYSGFVKGVDPLGSDYKFTDYFNAFGMSWMGFSTLFFSFLLSMAEFLIGICLFLNIKLKTAAWGAILFMGFFTPHPGPGHQESGYRLRMFRGCPDFNQLGNLLEKYHSASHDVSYLLHER